MIGIFNTITINSKEIFRPNDFTLSRENVFAAELETCTGKRIADLIGWRYQDMELSFDTLPQDMMDKLLSLMGNVNMTFSNELNQTVTEQVVMRTSAATVTRMHRPDGTVLWKDFAVGIRFINAHPNEED